MTDGYTTHGPSAKRAKMFRLSVKAAYRALRGLPVVAHCDFDGEVHFSHAVRPTLLVINSTVQNQNGGRIGQIREHAASMSSSEDEYAVGLAAEVLAIIDGTVTYDQIMNQVWKHPRPETVGVALEWAILSDSPKWVRECAGQWGKVL